MEKVSYGNGCKEDGKKVHSDSLFECKHEERATKSCKQLLMPAGSHQFQKLTLKCHNMPFLSHSWLRLSCNFKTGFRLLGHFSSHDYLSYGCHGSNLHDAISHEVKTYASGAQ